MASQCLADGGGGLGLPAWPLEKGERRHQVQVARHPPLAAAGSEHAQPALAALDGQAGLPGELVEEAQLRLQADQAGAAAQGLHPAPCLARRGRGLFVPPGERQCQVQVHIPAGFGEVLAEVVGQLDALPDVGQGGARVALERAEAAPDAERPGPFGGRLRKQADHLVEPVPALPDEPGDLPVTVQPDRERGAVAAAFAAPERVLEGGTDAGVLAAQLPVPRELVVAQEVLVEVAGHGQVAGDQPAAARRFLAAPGELGGAEVAQGAQQPVPGPVAMVAQHYRLVDQADERLDHRVARQVGIRAHLLGRRHVERPREHRKPGP